MVCRAIENKNMDLVPRLRPKRSTPIPTPTLGASAVEPRVSLSALPLHGKQVRNYDVCILVAEKNVDLVIGSTVGSIMCMQVAPPPHI